MEHRERPGRKIPPEYENPLDNLVLKGVEAVSPFLHATGHTPNVLTAYSAALGAAAVWALWHRRPLPFALCYVASYVFDCADGYFARRYGQVTRLGDVLDHIKDAAVVVALLLTLRMRYAPPWWVWPVLVVALALQTSHLGCQQRVTAQRDSLDMYRRLCVTDIRVSRWFGVGTFQLVFVSTVLLVMLRRR